MVVPVPTTERRVDNDNVSYIARTHSSGLFLIFTLALLVTHAVMICSNMTTVEQLGVQRMHEREKRVLGRLHPWWHFRCVFYPLAYLMFLTRTTGRGGRP